MPLDALAFGHECPNDGYFRNPRCIPAPPDAGRPPRCADRSDAASGFAPQKSEALRAIAGVRIYGTLTGQSSGRVMRDIPSCACRRKGAMSGQAPASGSP